MAPEILANQNIFCLEARLVGVLRAKVPKLIKDFVGIITRFSVAAVFRGVREAGSNILAAMFFKAVA